MTRPRVIPGEKVDRWIGISAAVHIGVCAVAILVPSLLSARPDTWGGSEGAMKVALVSSAPGLALPSPDVVAPDAVAHEQPGANTSEPPAKPETPEDAIAIPARGKQPNPKSKDKPATSANTLPQRAAVTPDVAPSNAVPYGRGPQPDIPYGAGSGPTGAQFGDGSFGDRFPGYVGSMRTAISQKWIKGQSDSLVSAPTRVYMHFTIGRDGTASDVTVEKSSGQDTLDRLAERAVRSAALPRLPDDYRGSSVTVSFWFEYGR